MRKHEGLFLAFWVVRIRKFRIKMELTQERLAEKLCLSTRNYQKLERGVHRPSAITIILFYIPALRPRNHLFHPLLWPDGRKGPFPGGCLTMQTKTPYIPTREQKSAVPLGILTFMKMKTFLSIGCTTLCQTLRTGSFPAHSSMRKTRSAKMRMEI